MAKKTIKPKKEFDKYEYYHLAVQCPEEDVPFFRDTYKELTGKKLTTLCEDFCGSFAISCEWVKADKDYKAIGVDLDLEPIQYGKDHYLPKLTEDQQSRIEIINSNVMNPELPKVECVTAQNFSYYIFKTRKELKEYFQSAYNRVQDGGLFIVDCFGGSENFAPTEEETIYDDEKFSYFWDQDSFDPIHNQAMFYIHFRPKGGKKMKKVFTYDWRMWSIPEIREVMDEVGFKKTTVYWEGTDKDGEGDGNFTPTEKGEDCETWIAYVAAQK